jgi:hypothetical protein
MADPHLFRHCLHQQVQQESMLVLVLMSLVEQQQLEQEAKKIFECHLQ